jgi:hypothetical protein
LGRESYLALGKTWIPGVAGREILIVAMKFSEFGWPGRRME